MTEKSDEFQTVSPEKAEHVKLAVETPDTAGEGILRPHAHLPKPEAPPRLSSSPPDSPNDEASNNQKFGVDVPAIGKLIRERSSNFSAAFVRRLSSLKDLHLNSNGEEDLKSKDVTEFHLSGLKVSVKLKSDSDDHQQPQGQAALKGRISFFSRSNCRDCTAVRRFLREKGLKFVEINIDVYPNREKELVERTGSSSVPQIFFNEKQFGGLVALNSLRNSGGFDQRLKEMLSSKCPDDAPPSPVYGFDDLDEEELTDQMMGIVRVLRLKLPIQDRLMKMKIVKNCFAGSEMVEVLIQHLDCGRRKHLGLHQGENDIPAVKINPEDVVALPYSSGTTGLPKGDMLTHKGLVTSVAQQVDGENLNLYFHSEDVVLCVPPLFHIYSLNSMFLCGLRVGAAILIMQKFGITKLLELVEKYKDGNVRCSTR